MRTGISRRQWLAGLLAGLGGPWLARLLPAAASPAVLAADVLRPVSYEPLGTVTTYTYYSLPIGGQGNIMAYGTYLGGSGADRGDEIAPDSAEGPSSTTSYDYPTDNRDPGPDSA
jgi:hypothetical protein